MEKIMKLMLAAAMFAVVSCEKEIEFEYHDIPGVLVAEGMLTQQGVTVDLSMTVPTDEAFGHNRVDGAAVTLTDLTGGNVWGLGQDASGTYTCPGLAGEPGHEYRLMVETGDDVCTAYCTMLQPTEILSAEFSWLDMLYDDMAVLKVRFTQDADPLTSYWLRVYRNGELYDWQAIESRNGVDGVVTGMMMTTRRDADEEDDDAVLRDGDEVGIEVMPVSKAMADYLNSLNSGDYNGNRMYEGTPCLGFFLAAPVARTTIIFHPSDF